MKIESVFQKIKKDAQKALKQGERKRVEVLRYLCSILQNEEVKSGKNFNDSVALAALQSEMKRKQESLAIFKKAKREDLIKEQGNEISILTEYLPEMMSREEIAKLVETIIGKSENANFGEVMGELMAEVRGKADGKLVAEVVKENLK